MEVQTRPRRWWVYDRPLHTDRLFVAAMALSIAATAWSVVIDPGTRPANVVVVAWTFLWAMVSTSIILGCVREFTRGRREGRPDAADRPGPTSGS